jgi:aminoglycoside 3-N-acetyltransferase
MIHLGRMARTALLSSARESEILASVGKRASGWLRRRREDAHRKRKALAIARHGAVDSAELLGVLREGGIREGDTVFAQSSVENMPTFGEPPFALLETLRALVGDSGTLLMPTYTTSDVRTDVCKVDYLFDVNRSPTYTGIVSELLRRTPGAIRSAHPRHSIAGIGPRAAALLESHEFCYPADGIDSPFDRLRKLERAWILTLGLPPASTSFLNWFEDIALERSPKAVRADAALKQRVRTSDGSVIVVRDMERRPTKARGLDHNWVAVRLSTAAMQYFCYRQIDIGIYPVRVLARELLALRGSGSVRSRARIATQRIARTTATLRRLIVYAKTPSSRM